MTLSLTYSLSEGELTEDQKEAVGQYAVQWVEVNTRNGRTMFESIVSEDLIPILNGFLTEIGREPIIIGGWKKDGLPKGKEYQTTTDDEGNTTTEIVDVLDEDGNPIENPYLFNETEYLELMPDIIELDEEGNEISNTRPTEVRQLHSFSGWQMRNYEA